MCSMGSLWMSYLVSLIQRSTKLWPLTLASFRVIIFVVVPVAARSWMVVLGLAAAYLPSALPYHLPTPDYFLCQGTVSGSHSLRRHSGEIERGPGCPPRIRSSLNSMTQQKTSFSLITGLMHLAAAVYCGTCKKRRIRTILNILSIYIREKKCYSTPSYKRPNA